MLANENLRWRLRQREKVLLSSGEVVDALRSSLRRASAREEKLRRERDAALIEVRGSISPRIRFIPLWTGHQSQRSDVTTEEEKLTGRNGRGREVGERKKEEKNGDFV
jgi:hypothetical protein